MSIDIQGPISLTCYSDEKIGSILFIFGDRHVRIQSQCKGEIVKKIDNFISEMPHALSERIDLFLEASKEQEGDESTNYLMDVVNIKETENLVKHFCDVRKLNETYINFYNFLNICVGLIEKKTISDETAKYNFNLLKIFFENGFLIKMGELIDFFNPNKVINDYLIDDLINNPYKNKILELIQEGVNKYLKPIGNQDKIWSYISMFSDAFDKSNGSDGYKYFINTFLEENKAIFIKLYDNVSEYGQIFMDAYILCKITNGQYNNSIVYVGEAHAKVYRLFLEKNKIMKKTFEKYSDTQCIEFGVEN
jgi:hypothetical protein